MLHSVSHHAATATRALLLASLAGCAAMPADHGPGAIADLVQARTGVDPGPVSPRRPHDADDAIAVRRVVDDLLARPLAVDDAIRIALLDNPSLRAEYAQLGFAAADLIAAARPGNPGFTYAKLRYGGEREIDRTPTFDVVGLLTIPWRSRIAAGQFDATRYAVAGHAVRVANDARRAWVHAVAAQQSMAYYAQARDAAEAAAELGRRMQRAGNWPRLTALREQAFLADAFGGAVRAGTRAQSARERLARVLGIDDASRIRLPDRLPDLPVAPRDTAASEGIALDERLDVRAARARFDATAQELGLARVTRFVDVLDLGYQDNTFTENGVGGPKQQGFEVSIEIPLFDFGAARATRSAARYDQSAALLAQAVVTAKSEVREHVAIARDALALARYYRTEVVPLRASITDETTLRYDGMLASVFELLADAREQMNAVATTIDVERDYWLADADLQFALTTGSPSPEDAR